MPGGVHARPGTEVIVEARAVTNTEGAMLNARRKSASVGDAVSAEQVKKSADRDVAEGMVFIPFAFAEAPANMLTNPKLDPMGKIPEFKFCACRIARASLAPAAAE